MRSTDTTDFWIDGVSGLLPSKVPLTTVEHVLGLYRDRYFDFNVRHFHEKLVSEHGISLSYSWVKAALQVAGLVARRKRRGKHRRRRERRPLSGMLLHIDGSTHAWLGPELGRQDLITALDDATSEVYYAQLCEQESTASVMAALKAVVEEHGVFCSLYSDRASHFVYTETAGRGPQRRVRTQVGRALEQVGVELIPANSPQARGRCEALRNFPGTAATGAAAARSQFDRKRQPLPVRDLRSRTQREVLCPPGSGGNGPRAVRRRGSPEDLFSPGGESRRQRQHRHLREAAPSDRASDLPLQPCPMPRARLPAFGPYADGPLRTPIGSAATIRKGSCSTAPKTKKEKVA